MEVYLDNSATTKPYDEVAQTVSSVMLENYGNPSSLHKKGKLAEDLLEECRKKIADTLHCVPREIYFTGGGTESDNISILGYCSANRRNGNRVITQKTEHAAVLESFKQLEQQGFDVIYIDVDSKGFPDMDALRAAMNEDTVLLSFMAVNNENGAIFPLEEISALCDHKKCMLHVDAVQAYGKLPLDVKKQRIDLLSVSAHKIHGPRGIGALYVKNGVRVNPVLWGGKQENNIHSGTENLPAIAGFARAAEIKFSTLSETEKSIAERKQQLLDTLQSRIENIVINSPENSLYAIANVSFPGVKSEVLLHVLESNGIYVSTGSACNSKKNKYSYVLKEMKLADNVIDSAVRFSFSEWNTTEEINYVCDVLAREIPLLRRIMR